jgi:hypothetical protein
MKSTTLEQLTSTMTVAGPALSASTTRTSILDPSAKIVIPAGFWEVGKQVQIQASGQVSCVVTTPGTLLLDLDFLNPTPAHVIVAASQAMGLNIVAKTNVSWLLQLLLTCRSVGAGTAATLMFQGLWTSEAVVGSPLPSAGGSGSLSIPPSAPVVGTGFDSTVNQTIDMFATFSVNTAGTAITCQQFSLLTLN